VNYLAPFLLTNLLLDTLRRSAPSRIVNVTSVAHRWGHLDFDSLGLGRSVRAYSNSKLALILFTYELARRLGGTRVTANCLHPGVVATNLWRVPSWLTGLFMVSAREGADTPIFLATSPDIEGVTGKYFHRRAQKNSSATSYDQQLAERLWHASAQLVGLAVGNKAGKTSRKSTRTSGTPITTSGKIGNASSDRTSFVALEFMSSFNQTRLSVPSSLATSLLRLR
jgi:hypothetical protein